MNYNVELTKKFNAAGFSGKVVCVDGNEEIIGLYLYSYYKSVEIDGKCVDFIRAYKTWDCFDENEHVKIVIEDDNFKSKYGVCYECNKICLKKDIVDVEYRKTYDEYDRATEMETHKVCKNCVSHINFYICDDCGALCHSSAIRHVCGTDKYSCLKCDFRYYECPSCNSLFASEDEADIRDGLFKEDCFCKFCRGSNNHLIRRYHAMKKRSPYSFMTSYLDSDNPAFIGFELEIDKFCDDDYDEDDDYIRDEDDDNNYDCARDLYDMSGDLLRYEYDGSLSRGFEIISQPITKNYFNENENLFKKILSTCVEHGYSSHDVGSCGLHMHMNKSYFGKSVYSAMSKLLMIFDKHWDNLRKFSRRKKLNYCNKYDFSYSCSDTSIAGVVKHSKTKGYLDRYFAINLTNDNTIEVRLWRGTLNFNTFKATLKFTYRLMELCRDTSAAKLCKMSWEEILGDDPDIISYWESRKNR